MINWNIFKFLIEDVPKKDKSFSREPLNKEIRKTIRNRDKNCCKICSGIRHLNVHHIIPNGSVKKENLILLCCYCHEFVHKHLRHKGYYYFRSSQMFFYG